MPHQLLLTHTDLVIAIFIDKPNFSYACFIFPVAYGRPFQPDNKKTWSSANYNVWKTTVTNLSPMASYFSIIAWQIDVHLEQCQEMCQPLLRTFITTHKGVNRSHSKDNWYWYGHVKRMPENILHRPLMEWGPPEKKEDEDVKNYKKELISLWASGAECQKNNDKMSRTEEKLENWTPTPTHFVNRYLGVYRQTIKMLNHSLNALHSGCTYKQISFQSLFKVWIFIEVKKCDNATIRQ